MRMIILLMAILIRSFNASPDTPAAVGNPVDTTKLDLAAFESNLLADLNGIRLNHNLSPFEMSQRFWYKAKNHSRQMAVNQRMQVIDLKEFLEFRAGSNPISFWAGVSGYIAQVKNLQSNQPILDEWLKEQQAREDFLSPQYNRAAAGISVDRDGSLFATLIIGQEVYQDNNLRRLEKKVFDSVNALRAKKGLRPLLLSEPLSRMARGHSESMALGYFFSHTDLRGMGLSDRLKLHRINHWQMCAENIGSNQGHRDPLKTAIMGWMESRPHAKNILHPEFTHTGIGVAKALNETYYFTQVFFK